MIEALLSTIAVATIVVLPGAALFATVAGNGARRWPWTQGVVVAVAFGVAVACLVAIVLGAISAFSLGTEGAAVAAVAGAILAAGRFRVAMPFSAASRSEAAELLVVVALAGVLFPARRFEMLLGERDATTYVVGGIGLARQGSLILTDRAAELVGDRMLDFYPLRPGYRSSLDYEAAKYQGFYYLDRRGGRIVAQGFHFLPAVIAIAYGAFGIDGALAANAVLGILGPAAVFTAGTLLLGPLAGFVGGTLLALNLVEVWAARYPVAEIFLQALLFSGLAAFLRRDRLGEGIAGLLLGSMLLTKVESALLVLPLAALVAGGRARRRPIAGPAFWVPFLAVAIAALVYAFVLHPDYLTNSFKRFWYAERRLVGELFGSRRGVPGFVLAGALAAAGAAFVLVASRRLERWAGSGLLGRAAAITVGVLVAYGWWVRPLLAAEPTADAKSLVWLSWYVSPGVLLVAVAGLVHSLWRRKDAHELFALATLLTFALAFLQLTFVNLHHIYMTRRFVPAVLPIVCLFFGHAVAEAARAPVRRSVAGMVAAVLMLAAAASFVARSRHIYVHREYPGLVAQLSALAGDLSGADVVLLSDRKVRDLLGPALEFVFGLRTLVVWPYEYAPAADLITRWTGEGRRLAALTFRISLAEVGGAEELEPVARPRLRVRALSPVRDRFPLESSSGILTFTRYAGGPGSHPVYDFWKREGERLAAAVCGSHARVVGGDPYLVRRVRARCGDDAAGGPARLVAQANADREAERLRAFGARFERRDLGGAVLFADLAPEAAPRSAPLRQDDWKLDANCGSGTEALAADGRLDTRWGSGGPQKPGMSFTVAFSRPMDLSWVRIRMGRFGQDRAQALAVETSADGDRWQRRELADVRAGITWVDGAPEENGRGDLDLRADARGARFLRLVNLGESPKYDWSIAELAIDGAPAADAPRPGTP